MIAALGEQLTGTQVIPRLEVEGERRVAVAELELHPRRLVEALGGAIHGRRPDQPPLLVVEITGAQRIAGEAS